uniref:Uncharacterized protein n=1 Tax=Arundo donax TaxID=35708 RepID=A0A0A8YNL4_ARUDO
MAAGEGSSTRTPSRPRNRMQRLQRRSSLQGKGENECKDVCHVIIWDAFRS